MNDSVENNKIPTGALQALDILLGLALVLIMFDYARDFLSSAEFYPTNLNKTSFGLFMSRWVTYFGATILMLAAGLHIGFKKNVGWDKRNLAIYLVKRAIFLIALDLIVVSFGSNFSFAYAPYFMMLGSLGLSFLVLAILVYFPSIVSLSLGALIILSHDLLPASVAKNGKVNELLGVALHGRGPVVIYDQMFLIVYSLIPWLGVVLLGYGLASIYNMSQEERKRWLMRIGLIATATFIIIRGLNGFGDPMHWWAHDKPYFTFLSFINVSKFPASMLYLLMTLGPSFMLLSWLEGKPKPILRSLELFGKTPLFFYVTTLYLIHILSVLAGSMQGFQPILFIAPVWQFPDGFGYGLLPILLFSVGLLVVIYPLCRLVDSAIGERFPLPTTSQNPRSWPERIKLNLRNF